MGVRQGRMRPSVSKGISVLCYQTKKKRKKKRRKGKERQLGKLLKWVAPKAQDEGVEVGTGII